MSVTHIATNGANVATTGLGLSMASRSSMRSSLEDDGGAQGHDDRDPHRPSTTPIGTPRIVSLNSPTIATRSDAVAPSPSSAGASLSMVHDAGQTPAASPPASHSTESRGSVPSPLANSPDAHDWGMNTSNLFESEDSNIEDWMASMGGPGNDGDAQAVEAELGIDS